jgi:hypothetical protein
MLGWGQRNSNLRLRRSEICQRFKVSPFHAATILVLVAFDGFRLDASASRSRRQP